MGCCASSPAGAETAQPAHAPARNAGSSTIPDAPPQLPPVTQRSTSGNLTSPGSQTSSQQQQRGRHHRLSLGPAFGRHTSHDPAEGGRSTTGTGTGTGAGETTDDESNEPVLVSGLGEHPNRPLRQPLATELRLPTSPIIRGPSSPQNTSAPQRNTQASEASTLVPGSSSNNLSRAVTTGQSTDQWTMSRLHAERSAYFDTRTTGQKEVWASLRLVGELLGAGQIQEAQGVFDATGCTCPSGLMWRGIFDERGALYRVPVWCLGVPPSVATEDGHTKEEATESNDDKDAGRIVESADQDDGSHIAPTTVAAMGESADALVPSALAPKQKETPQKMVKVKARLSDRATDVVVKIASDAPVADLISNILSDDKLPPKTRIRIAYMGKILDESSPLAEQGWSPGHVVNALVFNAAGSTS